jgi:hypothetical protein
MHPSIKQANHKTVSRIKSTQRESNKAVKRLRQLAGEAKTELVKSAPLISALSSTVRLRYSGILDPSNKHQLQNTSNLRQNFNPQSRNGRLQVVVYVLTVHSFKMPSEQVVEQQIQVSEPMTAPNSVEVQQPVS